MRLFILNFRSSVHHKITITSFVYAITCILYRSSIPVACLHLLRSEWHWCLTCFITASEWWSLWLRGWPFVYLGRRSALICSLTIIYSTFIIIGCSESLITSIRETTTTRNVTRLNPPRVIVFLFFHSNSRSSKCFSF